MKTACFFAAACLIVLSSCGEKAPEQKSPEAIADEACPMITRMADSDSLGHLKALTDQGWSASRAGPIVDKYDALVASARDDQRSKEAVCDAAVTNNGQKLAIFADSLRIKLNEDADKAQREAQLRGIKALGDQQKANLCRLNASLC